MRALNRALLARQMLLERARVPVAAAIERLVGLQAQLPGDPYVALWSRLSGFDPEALSKLIATRKAVRIAVMRDTLHLVSARDALALRPLVQPVLSRMFAGTAWARSVAGISPSALAAVGRRAVEARPLTLAELRPILTARFPGREPRPSRTHSAARHRSCRFRRAGYGEERRAARDHGTSLARTAARPAHTREAGAALSRCLRARERDGRASLVGSHRARPGLRAAAARLVSFGDEAGRELFDLEGAPRPDPGAPAPPRFLPVYDNAILGFARRERILRGAPPRALPQNQNVRAFLIDGFVAGFWKIEQAKGQATLSLEPFGRLARRDAAALEEEGERLLAFTVPDAHATAVRFGRAY